MDELFQSAHKNIILTCLWISFLTSTQKVEHNHQKIKITSL